MITKIMELRIRRGLTRDEIVAALRLDEREYELIELGLKDISMDLENRIYKLLEVKGA